MLPMAAVRLERWSRAINLKETCREFLKIPNKSTSETVIFGPFLEHENKVPGLIKIPQDSIKILVR